MAAIKEGARYMNPVQCRMARVALDWSSRQLASAAGVLTEVAQRFQAGQPASATEIYQMRLALEAAGIVFIDDNGDGLGVRLRNQR